MCFVFQKTLNSLDPSERSTIYCLTWHLADQLAWASSIYFKRAPTYFMGWVFWWHWAKLEDWTGFSSLQRWWRWRIGSRCWRKNWRRKTWIGQHSWKYGSYIHSRIYHLCTAHSLVPCNLLFNSKQKFWEGSEMQVILEKQDLFEPFTALSDAELAQTQFHCHEQPQKAK